MELRLRRMGLRKEYSLKAIRARQAYFDRLPAAAYPKVLSMWYENRTGRKLDLKRPRSFNEKIQWLKLNDTTPLKTRLADKYLARAWVAERIGEDCLIPLLGVWDNAEEIEPEKLPERFVLKCNHGRETNIIVRNKADADWTKIRARLNYWLQIDFSVLNGGMELQYRDIPRKIIAEAYIEQSDGGLCDFKIHCFHGKPFCIQLVWDRDMERHRAKAAYYDTSWRRMNLEGPFAAAPYPYGKPDGLEEMLRAAERLAEPFLYVRVDFYYVKGRLLFGEMTFTPTNGAVPWKQPGADEWFGRRLHLPLDETICG